jgi:GMP synthase (glutamine-hydrolysing)
LETILDEAGVPYQYVDLFQEIPPRLDVDRLPGLIVMGGPMNVDETEQYPFLAREVQWIQQALAARLPVLGICLGAQLIAKALGARVYPLRKRGPQTPLKEIGWYDIELLPQAAGDPLLGACFDGRVAAASAAVTVFQWHGDTFDLPPGVVHLARSAACPHQAFRHGDRAWALQFHIEMTAAMIDDWLGVPGNCRELHELDYIDPAAIRAQTPQELPALQVLAGRVLRRFAALCRE